MGQEIHNDHFHKRDFDQFEQALASETALLTSWFKSGRFSATPPAVGLELEAWLLDSDMHPAPHNSTLIEQLQHPLVVPELARFNIEINSTPQPLQERPFSQLQNELTTTWQLASCAAEQLNTRLAMIGTLPTIQREDLCLANMSTLQRYRALNEQVMRMRRGTPLEFEIEGREPFQLLHHDVMMEATATSLQIHLQVPYRHSVAAFNNAIRLSAAMVALCANAPYLFGRDLWDDSRIPLFEQAVNVDQLSHRLGDGRVSFGTGYARNSLLEFFQENQAHYPVMLPICQPEPAERLSNLMLHNGTIWRWNRPLIGLDPNGNPHLRIEHRVASAGPTPLDVVANSVFFIGTAMGMLQRPERAASDLPFPQAKRNFYRAARYGLDCAIHWGRGEVYLKELIRHELLPLARIGLQGLELEPQEWRPWLEIIEGRIGNGQNGARWQRQWVAREGWEPEAMVADYLQWQCSDNPVHQWAVQSH
jgi:gamma-glutamyl:cysteine ligase YbdK (ATP-grasp superfamily)